MIIYAIVEASTQSQAVERGKNIFNELTGDVFKTNAVFDYSVCFDKEGLKVAGVDRWGNLPVAAHLDSAEGQQLLNRGIEETESRFAENLEEIKQVLRNNDDEEIIEDTRIRLKFNRIGRFRGSTTPMYTERSVGIRNRDHLDEIIAEGDNLWIVPADAHF